jgi:hypothetical protein
MMLNDSNAYELLGEIGKLLKKYGKDTFSELITILRDPSSSNQIANLLENTANIFPQKKRIHKRPSAFEEQMKFRESLISFEKVDPEKAKLLLPLFDSLQAKRIFPSLRELVNFISDLGFSVPGSKSRDKIIISFIKRCKEFPLQKLYELINTINSPPLNGDTDRSLAGWGKVILDKKIDNS